MEEIPWNIIHHHSSFLPSLDEIPSCLEAYVSHSPTPALQTPIWVHKVLSEGNMGNINSKILLDVSVKPRIIENIHIGVSFSPDEIRIYSRLFK